MMSGLMLSLVYHFLRFFIKEWDSTLILTGIICFVLFFLGLWEISLFIGFIYASIAFFLFLRIRRRVTKEFLSLLFVLFFSVSLAGNFVSILILLTNEVSPRLRNPTYSEACRFMVFDQTDKHGYSEKFNCVNFTFMTISNASNFGFFCYPMLNGPDHMIVVFNTIDKGEVFFEPQSDLELFFEGELKL